MRRFVVIGGGIGGVCCVEELCRLCPGDRITLISASTTLKGVDNVVRLTQHAEEFKVVQRSLLDMRLPNLEVVHGVVADVQLDRKEVVLKGGRSVAYDALCIAAGARPKEALLGNPHLLAVRDVQSVEDLAAQLAGASRVVVVGNGGIALELVGALRDMEVVWVVKHGHIGDAFFDVDAAQFLLAQVQAQPPAAAPPSTDAAHTAPAAPPPPLVAGRHRGSLDTGGSSSAAASDAPRTRSPAGHAAGPQWTRALHATGGPASVVLEAHAQLRSVEARPEVASDGTAPPARPRAGGSWDAQPGRLWVELTNGRRFAADVVVSAVGVEPNTDWLPAELARAPDGGLRVDASFRTSVPGVYAVGDCCSVAPECQAPHWFQMRLWTQARLHAVAAARHMAGATDAVEAGVNLELFTHVTRFMGLKVVLLGLYNGQRLEGEDAARDVAMYSRALPGVGTDEGPTFVRVLLLRGRMQGAVLIGDTDLEETFENLILDGLDLGRYGPQLLDPDMELDHMFD